MTNLKKLEIHDEYKAGAIELLNNAIAEEPDSVIVLAFFKEAGQFKIKSSPIHNRLMLVGAIEEAKNKIILDGYAD